MTNGIKTIIFPVRDLAAAKKMYGQMLGVEPYADAPYYLGYKIDDQDVGFDPNGHSKGMTGPVGYFHVDDIEGTLSRMVEAGAEIVQEVNDVGGGRLIDSVKDADGNMFGPLQDTEGT